MLTAKELEQLQVIIARAASPGERAAGEHFAAVPGAAAAAEARRREGEWCDSACRGDRQRFDTLLAARGIAPDAVPRRLADVALRSPARLPVWGATLIEILAALANPGVPAEASSPTLGGALAPLRDLAATFLDGQAAAAAAAMLSAGARRDLIEHLGGRLVEHLGPTLEHRPGIEETLDGFALPAGSLSVHEIFFPGLKSPPPSAAAAWIELLSLYPVAGRLLATVYAQWRDHVTRLLERVALDRKLLEARLSPARPLGRIESVSSGAGDFHDGGASVTILGFASGTKVLLKPRDLRVAARFQELVGELNAAGLSLPLHRREVIAGDGYSWEEYVEPADCVSGEEVTRYHRRLGMLLGLLQWLEGRDFTADNVLACGEHPVLIDLEGLLQPRPVRPAAVRSDADLEAERRLEESPARIGILPAIFLGEPGQRGLDLSVLARPGLHAAPFATTQGAERLEVPVRGAPATLGGEPVDSGPYLDAIESGFAEMRALLGREAGRLAGPAGLVRTMAGVPVRYYHRNTTLYSRLLEASLEPRFLRDGVDRELLLERLWRAYFTAPQPAELIEEEIDALRRLDIPLFQSLPGGDALILPGGREVTGMFDGTAIERALGRLQRLSPEGVPADVEVIRSVFATRSPFPGERIAGRASTGGSTLPMDWLEVAAGIGDEILAEAIQGGDGSIAWIGLAYHPPHDLWRLERLGGDVLSGTGGLALVLAEIHRATGEPRFRAAAERILAGMEAVLAELGAELSRLTPTIPFAPPPLYTGVFYGLGAPIYTLTRCARLLARPDLDRLAEGFARSLPLDRIRERSPLDAVSGRAGLALALIDGRDPEPPRWRRELASAIAPAPEEADGEPGAPPYPPGATYLDCLPGTRVGLVLAGRRIGRSGTPFPEPATPGDLVALLAGAGGRATPESLAAAAAATASPADSLGSSDLLLSLQVALAAGRAGAAASFGARAEALALEMVRRRTAHGSWFPDQAAADRHHLSAVRGLGAVALAMLELNQPGAPLCLPAVE